MAAKENRRYINFECTVCKEKNYTSEKNFVNDTEKIEISKFCPRCKKHTLHKEVK